MERGRGHDTNEAEAEAEASCSEVEAEAEARYSGLEAEALTRTEHPWNRPSRYTMLFLFPCLCEIIQHVAYLTLTQLVCIEA